MNTISTNSYKSEQINTMTECHTNTMYGVSYKHNAPRPSVHVSLTCKSDAISDPDRRAPVKRYAGKYDNPHSRLRFRSCAVITVNWEMSTQRPKSQIIPATLQRIITVSVYPLHTVIMEDKCKSLGLMPDT